MPLVMGIRWGVKLIKTSLPAASVKPCIILCSVQSYSRLYGVVLAAAVHDLQCMLMEKLAAPYLL